MGLSIGLYACFCMQKLPGPSTYALEQVKSLSRFHFGEDDIFIERGIESCTICTRCECSTGVYWSIAFRKLEAVQGRMIVGSFLQ